MNLDIVLVFLLGLGWLLYILVSIRASRARAFFRKEDNGAPLIRRTRYFIVALFALMTIFALSMTALIFASNIRSKVFILAVSLAAAATDLLWLISRFGRREEVMREFHVWVRSRVVEESAQRTLETKLLMERQTATLEEGVKNLERTKSALLNVMEDLNKEKFDAMEAESRLSAILDGIADGIITIGNDGRIFLVNPVVEAWTGLRRDALVGRPWHEAFVLLNDRTEPATDAFNALLVGGFDVRGTHHDFIFKSGALTLPVSVGVAPVEFNGRRAGSVVVFRDVTVEKRIDRSKSEFISVASHQLRTPLTSMNWYVESILNKDFGEVPEPLFEPLETVHASGRRLAALINALLNVSRIEMGHLRIMPAPIDLNAVCDEVVKESAPIIVQKDLNVQMSHGDIPLISLDLNLVKIVVQNLIANAIRYTPPKGTVKIAISKVGEMAMLTVADTGVGIPEVQQSSVFKKMFRASNAVKTVPDGTGLGLYISKSIVEQFGGDISFVSKEGEGATFTMHIPVAGVAPHEGEQTLLAERMV